jgi:hypothetical protein
MDAIHRLTSSWHIMVDSIELIIAPIYIITCTCIGQNWIIGAHVLEEESFYRELEKLAFVKY